MTAREYPARVRARIKDRDAALQALGYRNYKHYLGSPAWRSLRARHIDKYGEACGLCETQEGLRQLHHMTYERVGQEELHDLVLLCANCHRIVHTLEMRGDIGLDFSGLADFKRAARYAAEREVRLAARPKFSPEEWTQDDVERATTIILARLKQTIKEISPERGRALLDDIRGYVDELAASEREGREYRPSFEESGLDFTQPPNVVIAQMAGRGRAA